MTKEPTPIFFKWRILLSCTIGLGILGITLALGVWLGQWRHLLLGSILCIALTVRAGYLYYLAYTHQYWTLEATCTGIQSNKLRRCQKAMFTSACGAFTYQYTRDRELYPDEEYIFYFRKRKSGAPDSTGVQAGDIIDFSVKL